jgi:DNA-binding CsgD family transcriptional regulator
MAVNIPLATPAARRARARILDLTRRGPADPDFLLELSAQLRQIVPFAGAMWTATDPLTTLATSPARVELEHVRGECERFWEREFLVQDFNLYRDLARAERPVASLFRVTEGRPERSVRYREVHRALGYGDELRGVFRSGSAAWGLVSLWREEGQPAFSVAEEKLVADLSAPIAEAFRRAALLQRCASVEACEAPGLLMFTREGALESFNDHALSWLDELPPTVGGTRDCAGKPIGAEILTVVAMAHAIAAGIERGVARARIQTRTGRWLVVHGFPLRTPQDAEGRTAVVIEPAKASEVAPIIVEAFDLGPRERQVTHMIARGLSTADIAERLCLSPHTVRDYVKSVFGKVGVSSRGELVARLFAEHYAEPLHDSIMAAPGGVERAVHAA